MQRLLETWYRNPDDTKGRSQLLMFWITSSTFHRQQGSTRLLFTYTIHLVLVKEYVLFYPHTTAEHRAEHFYPSN